MVSTNERISCFVKLALHNRNPVQLNFLSYHEAFWQARNKHNENNDLLRYYHLPSSQHGSSLSEWKIQRSQKESLYSQQYQSYFIDKFSACGEIQSKPSTSFAKETSWSSKVEKHTYLLLTNGGRKISHISLGIIIAFRDIW